jgi:hypothetical protein
MDYILQVRGTASHVLGDYVTSPTGDEGDPRLYYFFSPTYSFSDMEEVMRERNILLAKVSHC